MGNPHKKEDDVLTIIIFTLFFFLIITLGIGLYNNNIRESECEETYDGAVSIPINEDKCYIYLKQ